MRNSAGGVAHTLWNSERRRRRKDSPEIVLVGSYSMDDGRYVNNGWLQEMPDPITKLTWDNAALMSPAFAEALGVKDGDSDQDHGDAKRRKIAKRPSRSNASS